MHHQLNSLATARLTRSAARSYTLTSSFTRRLNRPQNLIAEKNTIQNYSSSARALIQSNTISRIRLPSILDRNLLVPLKQDRMVNLSSLLDLFPSLFCIRRSPHIHTNESWPLHSPSFHSFSPPFLMPLSQTTSPSKALKRED